MKIEAEDACGRFTARVLRDVTIGESRDWFAGAEVATYFALLEQKMISNAVDATNFAWLAMGQPTHAFDLDKVEGGIIVRRARKGERLKTLDGVDRVLSEEDLVVADHKKAVGLAGVMGGWDTMITPETKNVLVEAAWFDPVAVRQTARRHGLHTDASHRFERGADFNAAPVASALVSAILLADALAIHGISFTVSKGSIFAMLGSNGAGKTTTINILTTLIKADGGNATVSGVDVAKKPDKVRKQISLTGQFAAVDDILTGRENLELIADMRHTPNSAKIATDLLDKFDLTDAAERRVMTYSGGMRRRLDIAMSLIGNPTVIFFDEPTTGLDPEARNDMWRTIRALAKNGTTIFLTTQYLDEADELADQIVILNKGQIVANGTANELKKLVPSGLIRLTFQNEKQLKAAISTLTGQHKVTKGDGLTLTVITDDSVKQVADVFTELRDANIEPAEFSQKVPTLDDVFLKIIGDGKGDK